MSMSVLFVDQYGDFGGGQRIVSGLARWGVEEGIRVAAPFYSVSLPTLQVSGYLR